MSQEGVYIYFYLKTENRNNHNLSHHNLSHGPLKRNTFYVFYEDPDNAVSFPSGGKESWCFLFPTSIYSLFSITLSYQVLKIFEIHSFFHWVNKHNRIFAGHTGNSANVIHTLFSGMC